MPSPAHACLAFVLAASASCSSGTSDHPTTHADAGRGTGGRRDARTAGAEDNPLWVTPAARDFSQNPRLLERIRATPHGYFRFINTTFADAVCEQFRDGLDEMPAVNLHGDAHIEQYAVTDLGRGLTDFDDSATGPAIIDFMRVTTSMRLAARQQRIADGGEALLAAFFAGYREALDDPERLPAEPAWAARRRAGFHHDRPQYLVWAESLMQTVDDATRAEVGRGLRPYVATMRVQHPELPQGFFDIQSMGRLQMGIGSALDEKYLVRVRGRTPAPEDDVILEAKALRDLSGIRCMRGERRRDPFRILVAQSRLAYVPYPFLGYVRVSDRILWVHGWVDNYAELTIGDEATEEELIEVAHDIGVQLGRGQPKQIAAPLDLQLRRACAELVDRLHGRIESMSMELADRTVAAWERFRRETRETR